MAQRKMKVAATSAASPSVKSSQRTLPVSTPPTIAPFQPKKAMPVRADLMSFAKTLKDAMLERNMNASDLARAIWGTTTDQRGYQVAKNRDRIGTYLAGTGYPSKESLAKLCEALGLEESAFPAPTHTRQPREFTGTADVTLNVLADQPGYGSLYLRRVMPLDVIMKIMQLVNESATQEGS